MAKGTRATLILDKAKITYRLHEYDYGASGDPHHIGVQGARALGISPHIFLKTLMAEVSGSKAGIACAVIPSDCEVAMKKLAASVGGKSAQMLKPQDAERVTGYHVGGISPFGQKKRSPIVIEETVCDLESVYINAGQRGLIIELSPQDALRILGAIKAPLITG